MIRNIITDADCRHCSRCAEVNTHNLTDGIAGIVCSLGNRWVTGVYDCKYKIDTPEDKFKAKQLCNTCTHAKGMGMEKCKGFTYANAVFCSIYKTLRIPRTKCADYELNDIFIGDQT